MYHTEHTNQGLHTHGPHQCNDHKNYAY